MERNRKRERAPYPALRDTGDGPISIFKISPLRHCPQQCWLTTVPVPRAFCFYEARRPSGQWTCIENQSDDSCPLICLFLIHSFLLYLLLVFFTFSSLPVTASLFPFNFFLLPPFSSCTLSMPPHTESSSHSSLLGNIWLQHQQRCIPR